MNCRKHLFLQVDNWLNGLMPKCKRLNHNIFGYFIGTAFHHQDGIACTCDPQIQFALIHLGEGWVNDEVTVDATNANRANRSCPGDIGDHQSARSGVDG